MRHGIFTFKWWEREHNKRSFFLSSVYLDNLKKPTSHHQTQFNKSSKMKPSLLIVFCTLLKSPDPVVSNSNPPFDVAALYDRVEKGKVEIGKLQQRSMLPSGSCWKSALEDLQVSCKGMSPENQSRLAIQFTICYNQMLGFGTILCGKSTPVARCMSSMDANSQATFRDFFLHTQDMCYFIEHQLWQEKTSEAVNGVTNAVIDVTKNLEETKETQEKVLQSQQESLKVQSSIIKDNNEIYSMVLNVRDVFEDVQASAVEQRQVVIEVFDKLSRMQKLVSWIQGEMSLLDMMGFYFACILFGFFTTSTKRTQSARFTIVVLTIITLGMERYFYGYLVSDEKYSPEAVQEYIWIFRRTASFLGVVIIVCCAGWYRDPQAVQQNMLKLLNNRLEIMSAQMERMQNFIGGQNQKRDPVTEIPNQRAIMQNVDIDNSDSDSDTYSNYSEETNDSNDTENVLQEHNDRDGSNDENKIPERPSVPSATQKFIRVVANHFTKGHSENTVTTHTYNLRIRSPNTTPNKVLNETVTQFAKSIKHSTGKGYYSSDEEI